MHLIHTIIKRKDFVRVQKIGKQIRFPHLIIRYIHSDRYFNSNIQIGLVLSKKVGSAVMRNKIKRLIRASWFNAHKKFDFDYKMNVQIVFIPQSSWDYDCNSLSLIMENILKILIQEA